MTADRLWPRAATRISPTSGQHLSGTHRVFDSLAPAAIGTTKSSLAERAGQGRFVRYRLRPCQISACFSKCAMPFQGRFQCSVRPPCLAAPASHRFLVAAQQHDRSMPCRSEMIALDFHHRCGAPIREDLSTAGAFGQVFDNDVGIETMSPLSRISARQLLSAEYMLVSSLGWPGTTVVGTNRFCRSRPSSNRGQCAPCGRNGRVGEK